MVLYRQLQHEPCIQAIHCWFRITVTVVRRFYVATLAFRDAVTTVGYRS